MAVEILASLEQSQFDPVTAQQITFAGIKDNYFTPEKRNFPRIIVIARQKGVDDRKIATVAIDTIQNRGSVQNIASRLGITPKTWPGPFHREEVGAAEAMEEAKEVQAMASAGVGAAEAMEAAVHRVEDQEVAVPAADQEVEGLGTAVPVEVDLAGVGMAAREVGVPVVGADGGGGGSGGGGGGGGGGR